MINDETMLVIAEWVARGFELAGIAAIILGALLALGRLAIDSLRTKRTEQEEEDSIARFRRMLGRAILTGLELLVAADIILTVAVDPTLESVLVLGLVVIIRTFLSFSLEVEIEGRWPWQKGRERTRKQ